MPQIDKIVIHCSDSPQGRGDDAETIHRWHRERDWSMIGYHYVILEDGTRQHGRPEFMQGAHVRGYNEGSLGICLIGTPEELQQQHTPQFLGLIGLLIELKRRYPLASIHGHNEFDSQKKCPGFDVQDWMQKVGL